MVVLKHEEGVFEVPAGVPPVPVEFFRIGIPHCDLTAGVQDIPNQAQYVGNGLAQYSACHAPSGPIRGASEFGVSKMTVRRDLDALAAEGRVIRTHGGAASGGGVVFEFRFLERAKQNQSGKDEIAGGLVADGNTVILDSSTTTLALARKLRDFRELTVITTSLPIASELQYCDGVELILLGGKLRRDSPDLSGALTLQGPEGVHADVAFLGCDAIDGTGVAYNQSVDVAHLISAMAKAANRVFFVADSSKIGHTALGRIGSLTQWDGLICDSGLPADALSTL